MSPAQTQQVAFIVDFLRKGEQRKTIMANFVNKWRGTSPRTFDRRLKLAEDALRAEQQRIRVIAEDGVIKETESLKSKILTYQDRQRILSDIARGEMEVEKLIVTKDGIKKAKCKPDHTDIKNAISELNKMGGDYAPIKQAITDSLGNDKDFIMRIGKVDL